MDILLSNRNFNCEKYPNLGMLISPSCHGGIQSIQSCKFAVDNGAYSAWMNNRPWNPQPFIKMLDKLALNENKPAWVVAPDAVGDSELTSRLWKKWNPVIKDKYGYKAAFAVQDGHTCETIPQGVDVIFIGGSTERKRDNIKVFCKAFPKVHVARINSKRWLWACYFAGATSVDGTDWLRSPDRLKQLTEWLEDVERIYR